LNADASTLFSSRVGKSKPGAPRTHLPPRLSFLHVPATCGFKPPDALPTSVSDDPAGLRRARRLAHLLDDAVRLPGGFRVGLDPALSVLPVGGDIVAAVLSSYVIVEAWRAGVPRRTLARMVLYVAADATLGSIPVFGTVLDAILRVNQRNVGLFEEALSSRASRSRP
jgi:hypothetical protein